MATNDKPLKPRLPRGFADRAPADIRATERMIATIRGVYERYGFEPGETPLVEFTEAIGKFLPDQDRPNEGVFSFRDDDEAWLSLRYDLTAPLARYVAENYERLPKPYRSYRAGWVFRNEKPGPGRFRQFMQFDADTVGAASPAADAEMCMMMADVMEAVGFKKGEYVIKVNSRKVLEGLRESLSAGDPISEAQWLAVLRAVDKLDRLGSDAVFLLLTKGRRDDSGDFTPGAGLKGPQADNVLRFLGFTNLGNADGEWSYRRDDLQRPALRSSGEALAWLSTRVALGPTGVEGLRVLAEISEIARGSGYDNRVIIDPSVVRGLEYYTGPVFEAELLAEIPNEQGQPVVFGSVGGGGRYDGLVGRFMKENVPAVGFSIGVSRLQAALSALGKLDGADAAGPVVVTVMERERIGDYQAMVAKLRNAGIRAELYLGDSGMKAQLRYADRRNAPLAIIQGSDERGRGVVQVKDLAAGKALASGIGDHAAYREERPGQVEVGEDALVETVKSLLGRG